jgi:hypothetical protein
MRFWRARRFHPHAYFSRPRLAAGEFQGPNSQNLRTLIDTFEAFLDSDIVSIGVIQNSLVEGASIVAATFCHSSTIFNRDPASDPDTAADQPRGRRPDSVSK